MGKRLLLAALIVLLQSVAFAQNTIIMQRQGSMYVDLEPCQTYTIKDPGGDNDYPTNSTSSVFICAAPGTRITITGTYTFAGAGADQGIGNNAWASLTVYEGELLKRANATSNKAIEYPFCDCAGNPSYESPVFAGGKLTGTINYTSDSSCLAIFFESDATHSAEGFEITVTTITGTAFAKNFRFSNVSETSVTLEWDRLNTQRFKLHYGTSRGSWTPESEAIAAGVTRTTKTGLIPGTLYYYKLTRLDGTIQQCNLIDSIRTVARASSGTCVNFTDLEGPYAQCYHGNYANPKLYNEKIDYGSDDIRSRHTVTHDRRYDARATKPGDTLWTIPKGASASVRLGNWQIGSQSENITYQYTVDTNNYDVLMLRYAVVLQNPKHQFPNQPMFTLKVTDAMGVEIDPNCYSVHFVPDSNTEVGWHRSPGEVVWKDWTPIGIDLAPLQGRTIFVSLTTHDCNETEHYGYAYFTLSCERKKVLISQCGNHTENTFTMPEGFAYKWYRAGSPTTVLSTEQSFHTAQPGKYTCELSFLGDDPQNTCSFKLNVTASAHYPQAKFELQKDGSVGCDTRYRIINKSYISVDQAGTNRITTDETLNYLWYDNDTIYGSDLNELVLSEGTHPITLKASLGNPECSSTSVLSVDVDAGPCKTDYVDTCLFPDQTYSWRRHSYWETGIYKDTTYKPNGDIDSILTLDIAVYPSYSVRVDDTICTILENNFSTEISSSYDHDEPLKSVVYTQCDSIVHHYLAKKPITKAIITRDTVQNALPYIFLGKSFYGPIDTTFTLEGQNHVGCDSLVQFILHVCYNSTKLLKEDVCDNDFPYTWDRDGSIHIFEEEGQQIETIENHCGADSVITLKVNKKNRSYHTQNQHACNSYTWTNKTNVTYTQSCDTAKYTLFGQNAVGCDSIITLNLTIDTSTFGHDTVTECDSYTWPHNSHNYTETPTTPPSQKLSYNNAKGCDTTVYLHLTINKKSEGNDTVEACVSYTWINDITYYYSTSSPKHTIRGANFKGCDSTVTLFLTINNRSEKNDIKTACDSLVWHGNTYKESITHRDPSIKFDTVDRNNCDSTAYLLLTINKSKEKVDRQTACDSFLWSANGTRYTQSNNTDVAHLKTNKNCDSTVTLNLTVNKSTAGDDEQTECDKYYWHGRRFTESCDTATYHMRNTHNCDSTITLKLTIHYSSDSTETIEACYHHLWNGRDYTESNYTATYVTTNDDGCDSTVYLKLTISDSTVVQDQHTACDSFEWHGITYYANNNTASVRGINRFNCDSITILNLTINRSTEGTDVKSACDSMVWHDRKFYESNDTATFLTPNGNSKNCDSTTILHLTINRSYKSDTNVSICDNQQHTQSGVTIDTAGITKIRLHSIHGCDSLEYVNVTVWPTFAHTDPQSICRGEYVKWQDSIEYTEIPHPAPTVLYHSIHTCDSTITLDLSIRELSHRRIDSMIVQNDLPFTYNGYEFEDVKDTVFHFTNAVGCDSALDFSLRVCRNDTVYLYDTICANKFPHPWEGCTFDTIGVKNYKKITQCGSDSLLVLNLAQFPTYEKDTNDTICDNGSITVSGSTFSEDGDHVITLQTIHQCDSVEKLHLKVWPTFAHTDPQSICRGETLKWQDSIEYTEIPDPAPTVLYHSIHTCDSTITLDLSIRELSHRRIDSMIVQNDLPFTYNGYVFEDVKDTVFHFTNAVGCDSSLDFSLRVCRNDTVPLYDTICANKFPHTWEGCKFDTIGVKNHKITTRCGSDSLLVLHLAQFPIYAKDTNDTICDNGSITVSGSTFSEDGKHVITLQTIHQCDSVENLYLKVWPTFAHTDPQSICRRDTLKWQDSIKYTEIPDPAPTVLYHSIHTCDSTITLDLSIRELSDHSEHIVVAENNLPYTYNETRFNDDADTTFVLTNAVNCDSFLHFSLYVCRNRIVDLYDTICDYLFPHTWYNRTFDTIGQLYDTIETLCGADSVLTLHLDQKPSYRYDYYDTICDDSSSVQSGHVFNSEGTHRVMLQTLRGCDSAEDLHLKVWPTYFHYDPISICRGDTLLWQDDSSYIDIVTPAPYMIYHSEHGCDSTITLDLSIRELSRHSEHIVVAENNLPYTYNEASFNDDADTTFVLTNAVNCDSFLHFSLYVCRNRIVDLYDTICDNTFPHPWYNRTFDTIGQLYDTIETLCGADSVLTLHLDQKPSYRYDYYDTICDDSSSVQSGHVFNSEGTHRVMLQTLRGCDSAEDLHLKVWPTYFHYDPISICRGDTLLWQDDSSYIDIVTPAPYMEYLSEHGCDSTVTLALTVNELSYNRVHVIVAENDMPTYRYNGHSFVDDVSDTVIILVNAANCDSIVHFSLYVCKNREAAFYDTICDNKFPHTWNGQHFDTIGPLTYIIPTICGADSIITLHLDQKPTYRFDYYDTICDNQSSTQSGHTFNTNGIHRVMLQTYRHCDSAEDLHLKVWPTFAHYDPISICRGDTLLWQDDSSYIDIVTPAPYMEYHSEHGCDSVVTLALTVNELSYNSVHEIVPENDLPTYRYNEASFVTDVDDTVFILTNAVNCDSIVHFSLYVCRNVDSAADREICDDVLPLNWNDTTFEHGGLLVLHRKNWCGADSTVFLTVDVHKTYLYKQYDTICDNQHAFWENQVFSTAGTYTKYYRSIYNCDSTERLILTVYPTYDFTDDVVLCWGKTYRWIDSVEYSYRPMFDPVTYMLTQHGCDSIHTLNLIKTRPLGSDLHVEPEHPTWENPDVEFFDNSHNSYKREWYIANEFVDTSKSFSYRFSETDVDVMVKLIIHDSFGCIDTLKRRIHFNRANLWVNNIFTPNRFENNVMRIGGEDIKELECYVYTRQGQLVYKFNSINDVWDGTYQGRPCQQGAYTYVIRYKTIHDPKSWLSKVGTVTLIR